MNPIFSPYLDENNEVKEMDHLQALGLNKAYFGEGFNQSTFKRYCKTLQLKFHPDKNPDDKIIAEKVFKRVNAAIEELVDPNKREQYLNNTQPAFHFFYDANTSYQTSQDIEKELQKLDEEFAEIINDLTRRVNHLPSKKTQDKNTANNALIINDSLPAIIRELASIWRITFAREAQLERQDALLKLILQKAETKDDYYELYILHNRGILSFHAYPFLQRAAALQHTLAMLHVCGAAFAGHFLEMEEAFKWAFKAIHDIETTTIPELQRSNSDPVLLGKVTEYLDKLKKQRKACLPDRIELDKIDELTKNAIEYRNARGGIADHHFTVNTIFAEYQAKTKKNSAPNEPVLKPSQAKPVVTVDAPTKNNDFDFLNGLWDDFSSKIEEVRRATPHKKSALQVADNMLHNLRDLTEQYKQDKITQGVFVQQCKTVIFTNIEKLDKELNLGDYLKNLAKSFANFFIRQKNKITSGKSTLFTQHKGCLRVKAEETWKGINNMPSRS